MAFVKLAAIQSGMPATILGVNSAIAPSPPLCLELYKNSI